MPLAGGTPDDADGVDGQAWRFPVNGVPPRYGEADCPGEVPMPMPGKYEPLTDALRAAAARGQETVELGFDQVAGLVGGLPPSADMRQWWANNSQSQALAWRAAGFHVEQVYLDRRRVRFARGGRGGTYHDRGRVTLSPTYKPAAAPVRRPVIGEPIDMRVRLKWLDGGTVALDADGKPLFGPLEKHRGCTG